MKTQEERSQAAKTAILGEATELFGTLGFEATSIDRIAEAAGFAKGAVYHHFPNKRAVFEAVLDGVSYRVARQVVTDTIPDQDVLKMLLDGVRTYFRLCAAPETMRILLQDGPAVMGLTDWRAADTKHFGGHVRQALEQAMTHRVIRKMSLTAASAVMLGAIQSAAIECASREDFDASTDEYLQVIAAMLDGLRSVPAYSRS